MTVCVAAISNSGMILAASDRMLSTDEIAYEPISSKVRWLTSAICALWAGDASLQAEVLNLVERDIHSILAQEEDPDWFNVSDVVDLYTAHWAAVRRKRAAAALLVPLGLTLDSFVSGNHGLPHNIADEISRGLVGYNLPGVSCIIAGIDNTGPHIWQIHNGASLCSDAVGYTAIGAGARHADTQMMAGRHSRQKSPSETLTLVHASKKRAEVTPSVGGDTDVVWIGPNLGQSGVMPDLIVGELDQSFEAMITAERAALSSAIEHLAEFWTNVGREEPRPQVGDDGVEEPE